jgi:GDSL-like Lipase/Acylhydrolase
MFPNFGLTSWRDFFKTRRRQTDLNQAEDISPARFFASSGPAIHKSTKKKEESAMPPFTQFKKATPVALALVCFALLLTLSTVPAASAQVPFVGMGDSIGEGVQSADASESTQPFNFLNLIASRLGTSFPLPLIRTGILGTVGDTSFRSRINPSVAGLDLAVSGADVSSILRDRADATSTALINSETDLVLFPRLGSQIEIAETLRPNLVACWIGGNDVLGAVTSFDQMDLSQMTSISDFADAFVELAVRLYVMNSKVVYGTIPDVGSIGFLVDRNFLLSRFGTDLGLPATSRTSIVTVLLIELGILDTSVIQNPNFVLDEAELSAISQRIDIFNQIIFFVANYLGQGVADIHTRFDQFITTPPVLLGVSLTHTFLGGLFSLDGVHPSNIGHAFVANEFITAFNTTYASNIPLIDQSLLEDVFINDPFVDLNGNGRVRGRPFVGLLETVSWLLGISGDVETFSSSASIAEARPSKGKTLISDEAKEKFFDEYKKMKGKDLRKVSKQEAMDAFRGIFGLDRFKKKHR